jgi:hypothetical protein
MPSFCDNQQSASGDIPLEDLHTRTTPVLMQCTKVSYYAWLWLWSLAVVASCTKMRHVWQDQGPLVSTNMACLTFPLQFRTTADTLNWCYIVFWYCYRWIWLGVPLQMINGGIPQFTVGSAIILWQPTIRLEECATGDFVHQNNSNTGAMYYGKLLCLLLAVIFCCGGILSQNDVCFTPSGASSQH